VEQLFGERVRGLPEPTQRLLLIAAADDTGAMATVARAGELHGLAAGTLTPAEQAGLVEVHGARLEFRHPLVRSAVYGVAASGERRAAHRALADALADDEEHADRAAWHLAAAALEPDEEVVRALEQAAARAEGRAGYAAAARALERAAELSADPEARGGRLVGAARASSLAGRNDQAVALAEQALGLVRDPLLQAEIARVRGVYEAVRGRPADGLRLIVEAAAGVATQEPDKALELLVEAVGAAQSAGDMDALVEIARMAEDLPLRNDGDPPEVVDLVVGIGASPPATPVERRRCSSEGWRRQRPPRIHAWCCSPARRRSGSEIASERKRCSAGRRRSRAHAAPWPSSRARWRFAARSSTWPSASTRR
jgi:tetratricopeptide (TPR) repeat protein